MLRKLFKRKGSTTGPELPPEVRGMIETKSPLPLVEWLQSLRNNPSGPATLDLVLATAFEMGWSQADREKLSIFGRYYTGNVRAAATDALKYTTGEQFDPDLSVIALFALYHLGDFEGAYQCLRTLADKKDQFGGRSDYQLSGALICQAANRMNEVKPFIDTARHLAPTDSVVALNAYAMYFELGDLEAFTALNDEFDRGTFPLDQTGFAVATVALAQGDYPRGFQFLEHRYSMAEAHRYLNKGLFPNPRWRGEPLNGKTLLISAEQGLGDTIQLARYLPELGELGAKNILVEVQAEALPLLESNFPSLRFLERKYAEAPSAQFDLWTGTMSLPHLLGTTVANVPRRDGYLRVPHDNRAYWADRVASLARPGKPRIGLAWSGQPSHRADRRRSIPPWKMFERIRAINANFFAVQTEVPDIYPGNLISITDELITLSDTAALIEQMDLVITVDTSVVHIAGAIGKETWLLLPYRYEWRWGLKGEANPWYESVKVIRQTATGDWNSVLADVFDRRLPARFLL
jgi:hypothetical protein